MTSVNHSRPRTRRWPLILLSATIIILVLWFAYEPLMRLIYMWPTHDRSSAERLPDSPLEWVWSGGLSSTSIQINAKLETDSLAPQTELALMNRESGEEIAQLLPTEINGSIAQFQLSDLEPETAYRYVVSVNGIPDSDRAGHFTTPSPEREPYSFSFAVGSCSSTGSNTAVYDAIRGHDPLFFLQIGDLHYENIEENDPTLFLAAFDATATSPAQSAVMRQMPFIHIWDDHDYGPNNSHQFSPSREAALASWRSAVPHHELAAASEDEGIYRAFTIGRTRFILSDFRSERDPDFTEDGPDKRMMSPEQLAWFQQELLDAQAADQLIFWVNTVPWIAEPDSTGDNWGGYTYERQEIAEFVAANRIENLIILSGDGHMLALDDGSNSSYADEMVGPVVFHAGALDRTGSEKGGPYSHGLFPDGGQFGFVEVKDDGEEISVRFRGERFDGTILIDFETSYDLD